MKTDSIPDPILHLKYPRNIFSLKLMGEQFTVKFVILFYYPCPPLPTKNLKYCLLWIVVPKILQPASF